MEINWLQKFDNNRRDSIWYGDDIVTIKIGKYFVTIGAFGEIRACINGNYYVDKCNGGRFVEYLQDEGIYNDRDLKEAVESGKIEFENNNWFEAFIWDDEKKEFIETYDTVIDELDADDFSWVEPWLKELVD